MVNLFLKAKHWQLFLLFFALPVITYIAMVVMFIAAAVSGELSPDFFLNFLWFIPLLLILFIGGFFGWQWSIGVGLQKYIPQEARMNSTFFVVCLLFPFVYILAIAAVVVALVNPELSGFEPDPLIFAFIVPIHLFSIFCSFYCLYFVGRTIKTAEMQRSVSFSEYIEPIVLVWFYPIGVWFVQPKINKIIAGETDFDKDFGRPDAELREF